MRTQKPTVILIFGEPNAGKSWLTDNLHEKDYDSMSLDVAYQAFIKELYPKLYLESLNIVISQHYRTILSQEKNGYKDWREYVYNNITAMMKGSPKLVVEGYLLAPILRAIKTRLKKVAEVEVIYVRDRHYYKETRLKDLLS